MLEARHLAERVNAGVGATGDGQLRVRAEDPLDRVLDLGLDRPLSGLRGPAGEPATVVGDVESGGGRQTSSRKTISVESERRGPSLTIRV